MKRSDRFREAQLLERRQRVAVEAARLLALNGASDVQQARRKAAQHLGIDDEASLPRPEQIHLQLREYQRLFRANEQPRQLRLLRQAALQGMQFLARYEPRLVGAVLDGTADAGSSVLLHVFSDDPDDFGHFLRDQGMAADRLPDRKLEIVRGTVQGFPTWGLLADGTPFEIVVMTLAQLRTPPRAADGLGKMARVGTQGLRQLLAGDDDAAEISR